MKKVEENIIVQVCMLSDCGVIHNVEEIRGR